MSKCEHRESFGVVVVERSAVVLKVLEEVCNSRGLRIRAAGSVGEALEMVEEEMPGAVITSLELPGFSGLSLIAAMKSCPQHRAIPVGLATSEGGMNLNAMLLKPDRILKKCGTFAASVHEFLEVYGLGEVAETSTKKPGELSGRILLVEDSVMVHRLMNMMLTKAGAEVTIVENGLLALKAVEEQQFDLVLMDIEMPEMDGREAVKGIRAMGLQLPVLALTAHTADQFREEALSLGFNEMLTKPADRRVLISVCRKFMESGRQARAA